MAHEDTSCATPAHHMTDSNSEQTDSAVISDSETTDMGQFEAAPVTSSAGSSEKLAAEDETDLLPRINSSRVDHKLGTVAVHACRCHNVNELFFNNMYTRPSMDSY